MKVSKKKNKRDPLPEVFGSLEEAGAFWDTHDSTDYEQYMKEVQFDVELKKRSHEVRISDPVLRQVRRIARQQGVATETLVNVWLLEKVASNGGQSS
jgi:predicted DNA binding CopG/RHH family protein